VRRIVPGLPFHETAPTEVALRLNADPDILVIELGS